MTKDNIQRKTLSIRISTNGFCFCSYIPTEPDSLKYYYYSTDDERSMASNIRSAIESCTLIRPDEKYEVKVIVETDKYTCIPTEHDNTDEQKEFFRYCFPKNKESEIVANRINTQGFTILFPVEKSIQECFTNLGETTFYTPASIIISYLGYKPMKEERYMLAYLQNDLALVIAIKDGKAELTNIFREEESANTLFYLLSLWKESGFSQTDDTLYLCGDKRIEEFSFQAAQFIKNIKRINTNELFPSSLLNRTEGIPFDLQALILCE